MAVIEERVSKNGVVSYRVQIRIKGYPTTTATFDRKTDAKRWAQETEVEMRAGRYIKTPEARKRTLGDLIGKYEQERLPQRKGDRKTVHAQLLWWKEQLGFCVLSDVTPQMIAGLRDKLLREPIDADAGKYRQPATVIRYLASLSVCFSWGIKELGWIESNPVEKVTKPALDNARVRFLSDEEHKRLMDACKKSSYPHLLAIVILALSTGARKGEIMGLKWKDIDFKQKVMRLEITKNGERRSVPLSSLALSVLEEIRKIRRIDTQLIFPRKDGQAPFSIKKHWEKAVQNAGLEDFHFHDLRHTTASNLAMNGASLLDIAHTLGHKQMKMSHRYSHLTESHTARILESMNEKQFGIPEDFTPVKADSKIQM